MARIRSQQVRRVMLAMGSNLRRGLFVGMVAAVAILLVSAVAFWLFEAAANPRVTGIGSGILWVTRTLLQGEPPFEPATPVGHLLFYVVVIAGVGIIALLTGAVASKLIEWAMRKDAGMGEATYNDHIVICGWSTDGEEILRELHAEEVIDPQPVVVLAGLERSPTEDDLVTFVRGDPSHMEDLGRAGIDRARTAIILSDHSNPAMSADDRDAKTLLTALAVESVNPSIHTVVEVIRSENRAHFERAKADELIVTAETTGNLMAAAATHHGLSAVIADLASHQAGNEFYTLPAPPSLDGWTFRDALAAVKDRADAILVGIAADGHRWSLNPPAARVVRSGERILVIAESDPTERLSG